MFWQTIVRWYYLFILQSIAGANSSKSNYYCKQIEKVKTKNRNTVSNMKISPLLFLLSTVYCDKHFLFSNESRFLLQTQFKCRKKLSIRDHHKKKRIVRPYQIEVMGEKKAKSIKYAEWSNAAKIVMSPNPESTALSKWHKIKKPTY